MANSALGPGLLVNYLPKALSACLPLPDSYSGTRKGSAQSLMSPPVVFVPLATACGCLWQAIEQSLREVHVLMVCGSFTNTVCLR